MSSNVSSTFSQRNLNEAKHKGGVSYEFEDFRLDAARLMLYRDGEPVALKPKVVETLVALIEHEGEVISKDELMNRLWADSFVEEGNLTQNIYLLRKTLGNAANGKPLIETYRRRGYRFTGEIKSAASKLPESGAARDFPPENRVESDRFDSLAVLPLANESTDETAEYLSDGITESIINRLTQIARLRVVARNTVFQYKNKEIAVEEIGRALGVSAVLTGRVLQHDERLIVRVELVDAVRGWQIWGEQYDRRASDVLQLQTIIAGEISENLRLKLTGDERRRVLKSYTDNTEAYHLYIKARYQLNKRLTESIESAAALFQAAIDLDPVFAPAYVGLADCYPLLSLYGALSPREAYPQAKAAAEKALEIDPEYAKAYNSLGVIKLFYEWNWTGAEKAFRRAIELNPGYPDAHLRYGMLLTALGRFAEADAEFSRARALDPLSLITNTISGYAFYYSRRYDAAKKHFLEVIALDPDFSMAHFRLGLTLAQQNQSEEAMREIGRSVEISNDRDSIAALGFVAGLAGNKVTAEAALAELAEREKTGFVSSYNRVIVNIGFGDEAAAMDWLERAYEERSYWLIYLNVDPALDRLRPLPRFTALREEVFASSNSFKSTVIVNDSEIVRGEFERKEPSKATLKNSGIGKKRFVRLVGATAVLLLILLPFYFVLKYTQKEGGAAKSATPVYHPKFTRLIPDLNASQSTFTPDGQSIAYTLFEKGKYSVWMKNLTSGNAVQILPPDSSGYVALTFSSDGATLFYITSRPDAPNGTIVRTTLATGATEKIVSNVTGSFALSPDERTISYMNGDYELHLINTDGSGERFLAKRSETAGWYNSWGSQMSWSPDGRRIAVTGGRRDSGKEIAQLIEIDASSGAENIISTPDWNALDDVVWLKDGSGFVVAARESEVAPFQIWFVPFPGGAASARRITNDTSDYEDIAVSPDRRRLVVHQKYSNLNLFMLSNDKSAKARQITFGSNASDGYWGAAFAPGGKIIYTSPRGGSIDLWQMNADGGEQRQLTKDSGEWNARPMITPDGRSIIFASTRSGARQIWQMDAVGGSAQQLTFDLRADHPSPAPGGEWIYYTHYEGRKTSIHKISVNGGQSMPISSDSEISIGIPVASPDGKYLFVETYDQNTPQAWKSALLSSETGEILKFFDFHAGAFAHWSADSKSVYYMRANNPEISRVSIETDQSENITNFETGQIRGFDISGDERQIIVSRGNPSIEVVLVENFFSEE